MEEVGGNEGKVRRPPSTKAYIVLQRINVGAPGEPNVKVLAVRLNRATADEVVRRNPGTWVEKHIAIKYEAPPDYEELPTGEVFLSRKFKQRRDRGV